MINVSDALGGETTTAGKLYMMAAGYWDDDNQWIEGGYTPPLSIRLTPLPVKDRESTHGERLKADPYGERTPAYFSLYSKVRMPINSIVTVYDQTFKVTDEGNYSAGGYWTSAGQTMPNGDMPVLPEVPEDTSSYSSITIKYGNKDIPITRLMR